MFVYKLNEKEKHALANLLITLAASDGDFQEEEREIIVTYAENLEDNVYAENTSRPLKEICKDFESYQSRIIVLQKLMELSISDDVFHEDEIGFLIKIATYMGISEEALVEIEQCARECKRIHEWGKSLLTPPTKDKIE